MQVLDQQQGGHCMKMKPAINDDWVIFRKIVDVSIRVGFLECLINRFR